MSVHQKMYYLASVITFSLIEDLALGIERSEHEYFKRCITNLTGNLHQLDAGNVWVLNSVI